MLTDDPGGPGAPLAPRPGAPLAPRPGAPLAPRSGAPLAPPGQRTRRLPPGWEAEALPDDVEALLLRLPPEVTRVSATMRLAIQAEFGGWELRRTRLYPDGSRKVLLRRKRTRMRPAASRPDTELA